MTSGKRTALNWCAAGLLLFISGIVVFLLFQPAYPCMESGIGCSSVWEMLRDSLPSLVMGVGMIAGVICMFKALGEYCG